MSAELTKRLADRSDTIESLERELEQVKAEYRATVLEILGAQASSPLAAHAEQILESAKKRTVDPKWLFTTLTSAFLDLRAIRHIGQYRQQDELLGKINNHQLQTADQWYQAGLGLLETEAYGNQTYQYQVEYALEHAVQLAAKDEK